jgi:omega-6 fatty acid desaturase (delta-12 desaturase)
VPSLARLKQRKRAIVTAYAKPNNRKGLTQVLTTLVPLGLAWWIAVPSAHFSVWLAAGITLLMALLVLRAFVLMHECGHGSLFRSHRLNQAFGFVFGVVTGMPQYVWSERHAYHHATNGNWEKYRGPLLTVSVEEFTAMPAAKQRQYERDRNIWLAPLAGLAYLILHPRFTWLKGSLRLAAHVVKKKIAEPGVSLATHAASFKTRYWTNATQYRHITWNNIVLLSGWTLMAWSVGPALFFTVYVISVSLAGAAGIALFTVQHNFEHSYASGTEGWDYDAAALHGTSFLIFPRWLNWFTANIAYHHVHHLSAKIPNYLLARCHHEHAQLFSDVTRIKLSRIPAALKHILWDTRRGKIVSVAEYRQQCKPASA